MQLKHVFVIEKLRLIGPTSFSFAKNLHNFQNMVLSLTNAMKRHDCMVTILEEAAYLVLTYF